MSHHDAFQSLREALGNTTQDAPSPTPEQQRAIAEILAERRRQDDEWGGPEHDDVHAVEDWALILSCQQGKLAEALLEGIQDPGEVRHRLVQVAAVALAALESQERVRAYHAAMRESW